MENYYTNSDSDALLDLVSVQLAMERDTEKKKIKSGIEKPKQHHQFIPKDIFSDILATPDFANHISSDK